MKYTEKSNSYLIDKQKNIDSLIKRHLTALEAEGDGDSTQKFTNWVNQIISKEDIFMYLVEV